jgi:hypothetical protein
MKHVYKLGSQWTTNGGWRAVVVTNIKNGLLVWHENENRTFLHNHDGSHTVDNSYNLKKQYLELCRGTAWVNIWLRYDGFLLLPHETKEDCLQDKAYPCGMTLIASFKHDWTEGDSIE